MDNKTKQAMQMALDALEDAHRRDEHAAARWVYSEAMDDLREALAQPQDNTARCGGCDKTAKDGWALYYVECWEKAQPQGKWVDLTIPELEAATSGNLAHVLSVHAAIAKFKEKNTPPVVPQGEPVAWVIWGEGNVPELAWDTPKPDDVANALYYTPPSVEAAIEATKAKYEKKFDEVFGELIEKINGGMSAAAAIRSMK
jgi:hypothetical protein